MNRPDSGVWVITRLNIVYHLLNLIIRCIIFEADLIYHNYVTNYIKIEKRFNISDTFQFLLQAK